MNKKNTTKKSVKPVYVVDMTRCETVDDLRMEFIFAKAGKTTISENDLMFLVMYTINYTAAAYGIVSSLMELLEDIFTPMFCKQCIKKTPWYKRLWNWLTNKKN